MHEYTDFFVYTIQYIPTGWEGLTLAVH